MIENTTVFILGAGAHCSYGFPSGDQLKREITSLVTESLQLEGERSFRLMPSLGAATPEEVQLPRLEAFANAIANAGQGSIDAFLEANRHQLGFQTIGKAAIAQVLMDYEKKSSFESQDDWLTYLFRMLLDGTSSPNQFISSNKIGFITFNYDRFLETWLHSKIMYSFGADNATALDILNKIPIIHVYGTLGAFPDTGAGDPTAWAQASKNIKTIFESESDNQAIKESKQLLASAHSICLLGFGFHRENIELLDLPTYVNSCAGGVGSTCYDIFPPEWERFTRLFTMDKIKKPFHEYKCLQALRHMPIF